MKEIISKKYISDDGKTFFFKESCLEHEEKIKRQREFRENFREKVERMECVELEKIDLRKAVEPCFEGGLDSPKWYFLKNEEDFKILLKYYFSFLDTEKYSFLIPPSTYQMCRKTPCFSYGDIRHVHRIYASN